MRKVFTYVLSILVVLLFIGTGYMIYRHYKKPIVPPIEAIPSSSLLFVEFENFLDAWLDFSSDNDIYSELSKIKGFEEFSYQMNRLDSIAALYPEVKNTFVNQKQFISIHPDTSGIPSTLFVAGLPKTTRESELVNFFYSLTGEAPSEISELKGYTILTVDASKPFYYSINHGVFAGSQSKKLLIESISQMEEKRITMDKAFSQVQETAGKKVDANIFINQSHLSDLLKLSTGDRYKSNLQFLKYFASWTELDLILKKDEILLNGYTSIDDSVYQYLDIFRNEDPQKIKVTRILPYNTNLLIHFGYNNFTSVHAKYLELLKNRGLLDQYNSRLYQMNNATSRDILKYFTPWIGNEYALVITKTGLSQMDDNIYTVIHASNLERAKNNLEIIHDKNFVLSHKGYGIKKLFAPHLMSLLFGNLFSGYDNQYYTIVEDYFIFANSFDAIKNYINSFESGKSLKNNINYKKFADNISDHSNILCYLNLRNTSDLHKKYFTSGISNFLWKYAQVLRNFEGIAMQFSYINYMFYTSMYIKYNPSYIQEDYALWKVTLDDEISGQPYFVKDHRTNTLKIVVFDKSNQMYLIDHNGKIIWKRLIGEPVISGVHLIDYYRNGKIQYLFNTVDHIYLIDLMGRDVEDYPVRLPGKATNGIAVFDYDGDKNYRMMLAMEDNRIYNFNKKGIPVQGWKKPLTQNKVEVPIQHIRAFNKDYIVITDVKGNIRICNRRGEDRIIMKEKLINANNSIFYENNTNSRKGVMLTTDETGKLTYIKTNGMINQTDFGNFSPSHHFLYEDFDRNGHKDFIYLDKNELNVFDRFKNPIMSFEFKNEIGSSPVLIPLSKTESIIGIVSDASKKIYLFDKEGSLLSTPDMVGKTQILVGSLLNDGQLNIITGSGNTLYNYYFQ